MDNTKNTILIFIAKKKRFGILQQVGVTRKNDLTPRCKKFYRAVAEWGKKTASLQHKLHNVRARLRNATKVVEEGNLSAIMDCVNATTYTFIMQQLRTQQQKPHARRFTLDEKILSLTLLKSSAKGYRLLSKIFCLPSQRTLTNLLNKIPFGPGINYQMFSSLQVAVRNLKSNNDKLCVVIFDEIAINAHVSYNRKLDCMEGLTDFGEKRTSNIADHANVFMLKGVHRQWKQAIAFTFSSGPIKSANLKVLLIKIIQECRKIGLIVVGTVCDQGSANCAVINSLLRDTAEVCKRNETENKYNGFVIDNMEIVPLYDVPHLFKGIRNNLLTKDLHFEIDDIQKIARWEHIQQFYLLDSMEATRLCPKLSDQNIYPDKMNKMKVSTMAQVFSHTVGALMKRLCKWGKSFNIECHVCQ